jgi:hypothetical protein
MQNFLDTSRNGSAVTWKYPSCILKRQFGGEFYSIAVTNNFQQADTGTKMIHLGKTLNHYFKRYFGRIKIDRFVRISPNADARNFYSVTFANGETLVRISISIKSIG